MNNIRSYFIVTLFLLISCKKVDSPTQNVPENKFNVSINNLVTGSIILDSIDVEINAINSKGIIKVEFYIDGSLASNGTLLVAPYKYRWNALNLPDNSNHTAFAKAYDADGNTVTSNVITVIIGRFTPQFKEIITNNNKSLTIDITSNKTVEEIRIERSFNQYAYIEVGNVSSTVSKYIEQNIDSNTYYYYRLRSWKDGKYSAYSKEICVYWGVYELKPTYSRNFPTSQPDKISCSLNGNSIALLFLGSKYVYLYDIVNGIKYATIEADKYETYGLDYTNDGKYLFTGGKDSTLKQWNVNDGSLVQKTEKIMSAYNGSKYLGYIRDLQITHSDLFGGSNATVIMTSTNSMGLYGVGAENEFADYQYYSDHLDCFSTGQYGDNFVSLVGTLESKVISNTWSYADPSYHLVFTSQFNEIHALGHNVVYSNEDSKLTVGHTTDKVIFTLDTKNTNVGTARISPNERLIISGSRNGSIQFWDLLYKYKDYDYTLNEPVYKLRWINNNSFIMLAGSKLYRYDITYRWKYRDRI